MPIDFKGLVTTGSRPYDDIMLSRINDSLLYMPIKQRAAILGTMVEESGVNPLAKSKNDTYQGLLQWGADRYRVTSDDKERELINQLKKLRETINDTTDHVSWTFGGDESGYKSFREAYGDFNNPDASLDKVYRGFSYGYVRPQGKEASYNNRLKVAEQVYQRLQQEEKVPVQSTPAKQYIEKQDATKVATLPYTPEKRHDFKAAIEANRSYGRLMDATDFQKNATEFKSTASFAEGGFLQPKDAWDALSIPEKAEMMKVAVSHGIYNLNDIRQKYNEFAEGGDKEEEVNTNTYSVGNLVDAIYQNSPKEEYLGEPSHHYDFTQSEKWADAQGYYPNARGHRDDRVKKPAHPSHLSRGTWNNDIFTLTDIGMENPNYTMFGLTDGDQDPQAILTYKGGVVLPEVTVTPKGNYFYNPYDNIRLHIKSEKSPTVNLFWNGGEEDSPFTPIAKPVIPRVEGDQEAVNWIANWYNNRREQLYNNIKESDGTKTFLYDVKDRLSGDPIGRRAINHEYYDKLNNMARYKTASFEDLKKDIPASYDRLSGEAFGTTEPSTNKVYYDNDLIQLGTEVQNRYEGFSPLGIHIHERTHTSGKTDGDGKFTGYNAQTEALENILRLKPGTEKDEYLDASPEIYGRMMEFRYNHNMNPKKRYSKQEIQKMLDQENRGFKSDLQRYDLDTLTKALNEVAQMDASQNGNIFLNEHV